MRKLQSSVISPLSKKTVVINENDFQKDKTKTPDNELQEKIHRKSTKGKKSEGGGTDEKNRKSEGAGSKSKSHKDKDKTKVKKADVAVQKLGERLTLLESQFLNY